METAVSNPDPRPLPAGWVQHYEGSKQLWYYVQITVMPPKVSFTHPADIIGGGNGERSRALTPNPTPISQPSSQSPTIKTLLAPSSPSPTQGMTAAQKLYASSGSASAAPMIPKQNITNLSTSPEPSDPTTPKLLNKPSLPLPARPQSTSPTNTTFGPMNTWPSLPAMQNSGPSGSSISHFYTQAMQSSVQHSSQIASDASGPPQLLSKRSHQTLHDQPHTHPSVSTSIASGWRSAPHLTTTARPPSNVTTSQPGPSMLDSINNSLSMLNLGHTSKTSPPASSMLFSQASTKPTLPHLTSPPPSVRRDKAGSPVSEISSVSTISTITPQNAHKYAHLSQTGHQIQGVYKRTGVLPTRPDPAKLLTALKIAFSKGGNHVAESDLQAVVHAKPTANFHAIINALKYQQHHYQQQVASQIQLQTEIGIQHHRSPHISIDYQALITDIEKLQIIAQAQAEQAAQQAHQAEQAHQQAMEALKKQKAALAQQQATAHQLIKQQEAARLRMMQQQQAAAAAMLQAQKHSQQQISAQQQASQQQMKAQQEQANLVYKQTLQAWQQRQAGSGQPSGPTGGLIAQKQSVAGATVVPVSTAGVTGVGITGNIDTSTLTTGLDSSNNR